MSFSVVMAAGLKLAAMPTMVSLDGFGDIRLEAHEDVGMRTAYLV